MRKEVNARVQIPGAQELVFIYFETVFIPL